MKFLQDVDNSFILANGSSLKNIKELETALEHIDDNTFSHHVNNNKNDFANWVSDVIGDEVLSNTIRGIKDKDEMKNLVGIRLLGLEGNNRNFEIVRADEMPPDVAPAVVQQQLSNQPAAPIQHENTIVEQDPEEVVELREIQIAPLGVHEIDTLFRQGVPRICNILFIGELSTGKTINAMKILLGMSRVGKKALYLSYHDTIEKIINIMKPHDPKILDYLNSGNLVIKKLNPFFESRSYKEDSEEIHSLKFIESIKPDLVVIDSLSVLELSFPEDKLKYRSYIDTMFKYLERVGTVSIFIKELKEAKELNREFYENLLADIIILFSKRGSFTDKKVLKEHPVVHDLPERNVMSFFNRK